MTTGKNKGLSRRDLLRGGSLYGGALYLALATPRPLATAMASENSKPVILDAKQWATVEAITARIIPTDHEPGAVEANCVNFIDKALANEDAESLPDVLAGLEALDALCQKRFKRNFVALPPKDQDGVLKSMEDGESDWISGVVTDVDFFELMRALTIMGFMADPKYGGNRDYVGWKVARYPGPRHHLGGYTPEQMAGEEFVVTVWGDKQ